MSVNRSISVAGAKSSFFSSLRVCCSSSSSNSSNSSNSNWALRLSSLMDAHCCRRYCQDYNTRIITYIYCSTTKKHVQCHQCGTFFFQHSLSHTVQWRPLKGGMQEPVLVEPEQIVMGAQWKPFSL